MKLTNPKLGSPQKVPTTCKIWRRVSGLIEAPSDFDDDIANKYFEGEEITHDELKLEVKKHTLLILSALFLKCIQK